MTSMPSHDLSPGHISQCQICGSAALQPILTLGHNAPCDSLLWAKQLHQPERVYPLNMVICSECTLVQIDYAVAPDELFFPDYPYRSGITPSLVKNLRSTATTIKEKFGLSEGELAIDIGSNDGTLLSGFRDIGMRTLGVEPTNIARIANAAGIETLQEFFSEEVGRRIASERGKAQVVTAANMFAHVSKLGSLIRGVEHLLKPGGLFVTESHYLMDLIDTVQYDSVYHEHLKYYSVRSIIRLFDYYDFTVVNVDRIPNYGGSIRVYAAKGRNLPIRESVKRLLEEEQRCGLYDAAPYARFVKQVRQSKMDLRKLIVDAQSKGQKVVGVGSPGRASTLLTYCGIDTDAMSYIAEQSTSLKLGLFMPGTHIPIVDEQQMFDEQPEYAVMLSWHYWEPIVKKLRERGLRSKIVLPLPAVRVLEP
ncbi:MAG TPA: class I SAM-dependent methyltransferase [Steroidobacteraceae bacterium]|nr:class I SAM-dependent methyltransferase [Steroidobacteraceae bacterium]